MTTDDHSSPWPRFVYSTQSGAIRFNQVQSGAIGCNQGSQLGAEHLPIRCNQDRIAARATRLASGRQVGACVCGARVKRVYTHLKDKSVFAAYPRIRTPACVYAPPAYTHPCLRIRTYPRIRTLGCVYARTCVYAPTPAYKHMCVNAASGAYTHLPRRMSWSLSSLSRLTLVSCQE